jgi:hypothetical protein
LVAPLMRMIINAATLMRSVNHKKEHLSMQNQIPLALAAPPDATSLRRASTALSDSARAMHPMPRRPVSA